MSTINQQRESDPLVELLKHPEVRERLNIGILNGLSGKTQIDYVIGIVERAVANKRLHHNQKSPTSDSLLSNYDRLRSDPKYRAYFTGSERSYANLTRESTREDINQ